MAQRTLREVSRDVQSEAWSWNTDESVQINPTTQGHTVPKNTLTVNFSPNTYPDTQYVMRGLRVYDRNSQRYDFGSVIGNAPITAAKVVSQLEWDELPHAAQQYITIRSARIFSDRYVASSVFTYTVADEDQARMMLIRSEENTSTTTCCGAMTAGASQGIGYIPAGGTRYRVR